MNRIGLLLFLLFVSEIAGAQTTLKIATAMPEGSQWMTDMRAAAAEVKEKTDGRVAIKYYGGGSMGTDAQVLKRISIGALNGGVFTPSALMETYPGLGLYGLAMVFHSEAEAEFVRSRMDDKIAAGLEQEGFVSFGFAATGFAQIMSKEPVHSLDDLKGKRVWVPEGDEVSRRTMLAMGVTPIPLPITDVYTALQTGALDIVAMSAVGAVLLQYHTKLKYVTDVPLVYTMGFMAISNKAFSKVSAPDQKIVRDVLSALYSKYDKLNLEDDREAKQALLHAGLKLVEPTAVELERLEALLRETNLQMAKDGVVSLDLYQELTGHVAEYRREHSAAE
jgi:TRAP-type C4-dicarboxylate transport system substrate-binding protein